MTTQRQETVYISISTAGKRTGLSPQVVEECVQRSLIHEPLTDADLLELRRIRRLQDLGVNLQGIEIILRMRRRIQVLQAELARWERTRGSSTGIGSYEIWQRLLPWKSDGE
jgi:DNA-binding transcriptional MerR regulator